MKILIIEDEPSLREIMQRALVQERYVVETASTYSEADAKIAAYSYFTRYHVARREWATTTKTPERVTKKRKHHYHIRS